MAVAGKPALSRALAGQGGVNIIQFEDYKFSVLLVRMSPLTGRGACDALSDYCSPPASVGFAIAQQQQAPSPTWEGLFREVKTTKNKAHAASRQGGYDNTRLEVYNIYPPPLGRVRDSAKPNQPFNPSAVG